MPSKKNKAQINPFSMYMKEQEPLLRRRGLQFNSKKELVDYLYPHFNALSDFDRQKYKNMAKIEKEQAKLDLTRKFDDRGVPLSHIAAEQEDLRQKRENMLRHVRSLVHERSGGETLLNTKFYNLSVSLHCYTDQGKEAEYVPCEVALAEWTVADGLQRSMSFLVAPDRIPIGYKSRCREISETTHQVPLDHERAESNFPGLWIRLKNFINPQEELEEYPPVFTSGQNLQETEGAMDWLYQRAADRRRSPFKIYPLERLVYELFDAAGEPQLETFCRDLLQQGHFDYFTELACPFHDEIDNSKFCMLAQARRLAFILLDRVAGPFGVEVLPGRHAPRARTDTGVVMYAPTAGAAPVRPIQFKPSREKEPDLCTSFSLIAPTVSQFRGGDRETPVAAGPGPREPEPVGWTPVYPAGQADWSVEKAAADWPAPAAAAAAAPSSTSGSSFFTPGSNWGGASAAGGGGHPRKPSSVSQAAGAAAPAPSLTEQDFPSLGAPGGLAGRSRPLQPSEPRAPGRPAAGAAEPRVPVIGRGRAAGRTTVASSLAERFANAPGKR